MEPEQKTFMWYCSAKRRYENSPLCWGFHFNLLPASRSKKKKSETLPVAFKPYYISYTSSPCRWICIITAATMLASIPIYEYEKSRQEETGKSIYELSAAYLR
jgi:hypothetical protein